MKKLLPKQIRIFQKTIWDYYREHGRRFPWRERNDPYRVLVSEVMLQQTQADRVVPFFRKFVRMFPTVKALARAPLQKALLGWSGLGYNRRVLYLKRAAETIVRDHGGRVPRDLGKLDALPGIGRDTASAILAFAWNEPAVFVETNIRTVYLHFFFENKKKVRDEEILKLVEQTLPNTPRRIAKHPMLGDFKHRVLKGRNAARGSVREWYDAMMDYGAMLKRTVGNPNVRSAQYTKQKKFAGSRRELRGEIIRHLTDRGSASLAEIRRVVRLANRELSAVLHDLIREGFLKKEGKRFRLT